MFMCNEGGEAGSKFLGPKRHGCRVGRWQTPSVLVSRVKSQPFPASSPSTLSPLPRGESFTALQYHSSTSSSSTI